MQNEQILTVVVVIAVVAVIGRVIINRQQKGGINWLKVGGILLLAVVFVGTLLSVDSYRLATWMAGSVDTQDDVSQNHVVGRPAGSVIQIEESAENGLPLFFALLADSVSPTGYYLIKEGVAENAVNREVLVSQSDSSRTAIKRTTSTFAITRHPTNPSDYVPIYRLSLKSGEKLLAVMTPYDAADALAPTPVMTARPLTGKMADIAARQPDLNQMVYVSAFDSPYYAASQPTRLLYAAIVALIATGLVGAIAFCILKLIRK